MIGRVPSGNPNPHWVLQAVVLIRTSQVKSDISPAVCVPWVLQCWRALHFVDSGRLLIATKPVAPFRDACVLPQALFLVSKKTKLVLDVNMSSLVCGGSIEHVSNFSSQ